MFSTTVPYFIVRHCEVDKKESTRYLFNYSFIVLVLKQG